MGHALLAPSASERWISCPASVRMSAGDDWEDSIYAREGTLAHSLGELKARALFKQISRGEYFRFYQEWTLEASGFNIDEIHTHTDAYVDFLLEQVDDHPLNQIVLEQRVNTGLPQCWGTADAAIISPGNNYIHVVDLKYGQGVPVNAEGNTQLRLYGVGALEMFDVLLGDNPTVFMTIYQPRLNSISTDKMSAKDLVAWRDGIAPIAKEALGPDARFGPTDAACRWCPARGTCRARVDVMTAQDFGPTDHISPEEMGELLKRLPGIRQWCIDVHESALRLVYQDGVEVPGWKVISSHGRRTIDDPLHAVQLLIDSGYNAEQVAEFKLRTFSDLDRVVGKQHLQEVLGDMLYIKPGSPSLVEETDNRPSINANDEAAKEFADG